MKSSTSPNVIFTITSGSFSTVCSSIFGGAGFHARRIRSSGASHAYASSGESLSEIGLHAPESRRYFL